MTDLTWIVLGIIALSILWIILRTFLRLTRSIFTCGIVLILAAGILLLIRWLSN